MKNNHLEILAICAAACLLYTSCGDDTPINVQKCTKDADCENGQICKSGRCADEKDTPKSCTDNSDCRKGQICKDEKCVSGADAECRADEDCEDGKTCRNGSCVTLRKKGQNCQVHRDISCESGLECVNAQCIEVIPEGESCDYNDPMQQCGGNYVCKKGICTKPVNYECLEDADCMGSLEKPFCIKNHCVARAGLGEKCDEEETYCQEDLVCIGYCVSLSQENESCSFIDNAICDDDADLDCYDDKCLKSRYGLEKGEDCNELNLKCAADLTCIDGKCAKLAKETEPCDPEQFIVCDKSTSQQCIKNICTPVGGECTSSTDCKEKDSFCCLNESCGVLNRCVPYDDDTTHDEMCVFDSKPGIFEARIQCRWQPPQGNSTSVEMPPLVGHFGNTAGLKTVVAFYSYSPTILRFINPETCETLESVPGSFADRWSHYPAAADLDGDGLMEFIAIERSGKAIAYKWNPQTNKHEQLWISETSIGATPMVYDINGDGKPEIIGGTSVIDGLTGKTIFSGTPSTSNTNSIGNFDHDPDGYASLLTNSGVFKWNENTKSWDSKLPLSGGGHTAYADFGTPGKTAADFDFQTLDGYPEFVIAGNSSLYLYAGAPDMKNPTEAQLIMDVKGFSTGGPVTIGDFNNDGLPEIGIASSGLFGVYDPKCKGYEDGKCADKYVLWERWSQDASSGQTGSSLFDFDGDGQTEAVYADECFTRVYDGKTGKILFSAKRSSWTSVEAPVVADIDDDGSAEIIMGSDGEEPCRTDSGETDPLHEGIPCIDDEDCPTGKGCNKDVGLCTCQQDSDCNTQYIYDAEGNSTLIEQYACVRPIHPKIGFNININGNGRKTQYSHGTAPENYNNDYKVCRASRKTKTIGRADLMIFRDRLDRWVSSRNIWNQHAYNIINIQDNGQVQTFSQWLAEWFRLRDEYVNGSTTQKRPVHNNFRMNEQGLYGAGTAPDITGRFIAGSICRKTADGRYLINAKLCNRGTKPVGTNLPASFYYYDPNAENEKGAALCTSYTKTPVGVGQCDLVGCEIPKEEFQKLVGKKVLLITNENEHGHANTVECNYDNNRDVIEIDRCNDDVVIN